LPPRVAEAGGGKEYEPDRARAIFALLVTALVCIATYFIIRYLMAA
jgi:hypothetical protein